MNKSDIHTFDFLNVSDSCLTELLANRNHECRELGLVLLEPMKEQGFCGSLRKKFTPDQLGSADISKIWGATMETIKADVRQGRFQRKGSLNAYVGMVMRWRTADFFRRQLPVNHDVEVDNLPQATNKDKHLRFDEAHETRKAKLAELIDELPALSEEEVHSRLNEIAVKELTEEESQAVMHWLCLKKKQAGRVAVIELVEAVTDARKRNDQQRLTTGAIRSAKARGIKKLQGPGDWK